jgi:hypothetical protein
MRFSSYAQNDGELTPRASIVILCKYLCSYGIPQNPAAKLSAEANIRFLVRKIIRVKTVLKVSRRTETRCETREERP